MLATCRRRVCALYGESSTSTAIEIRRASAVLGAAHGCTSSGTAPTRGRIAGSARGARADQVGFAQEAGTNITATAPTSSLRRAASQRSNPLLAAVAKIGS